MKKLYNGIEMPDIGLGTASANDDELIDAIKYAVSVGYRLIDTAATYGNEKAVGVAISRCGIDRNDLFVTSKLRNRDHVYKRTLDAVEITLADLQCEYIDLFLIHWPNPLKYREEGNDKLNAETWTAMEELHRSGKIRAIGVSNFLPHHIDELLKTAKIKPMVNQIGLWPGYIDKATVAYCKEHDILVEAYSPLGTGEVANADEIKTLAFKYGKTPAQICLRFSIQSGFVPLPKSVTKTKIYENLDIFGFEITNNDMDLLSNMPNYNKKTYPHPDKVMF
jgi:diketogulonate reductase-like aldo/keto reductase